MRYLSVCSGIESASVAWHPLGWQAVGFAEIDPFASAVLAERYGSNLPGEPLARNGVPNFGDFTAIDLEGIGSVDLLVGGTPCQAFSFAGARQSLRDARGNLTLAYAVLAHELARSHGLRNALWENVPGVLSTDDNAFGCFIGALVGASSAVPLPDGVKRWPDAGMAAGPRARLAWRLLDAQYFGLAQRRARVFVVVDFGSGADPAAVLFESQGLRGNSAPRREAGEATAGVTAFGLGPDCFDRTGEGAGGIAAEPSGLSIEHELAQTLRAHSPGGVAAFGGGNRSGAIDVAATLTAKGQRIDFEVETFIASAPALASTLTRGANRAGRRQEDDVNLIAHTLRGEGFDASEDGTGRGIPLVVAEPFMLAERGREGGRSLEYRQDGTANAILTPSGGRGGMGVGAIAHGYAVRRLTPVECARLQGFPDHHARIAWRGKPDEACPDGLQYKTFGNSMAVNVMAWLGQRLQEAMPR